MKKPLPLSSILEQTLRGLELEAPIKTYSIFSAWKEIVGEAIAHQTKPRVVRNRILFLDVSHSTWMQQLQFLKSTLLEKINGFLGEHLIEDIRFKVAKIPQKGTPLDEGKQEKREEKLERGTMERIDRLIENVTDAKLKKTVRELLVKGAKAEQRRKRSRPES